MRSIGTIKAFLIFCSGSDKELLYNGNDQSDLDKHANIGAAVLFTGIFAFISSTYALYHVGFGSVGDEKYYVLVISSLWALLIFTLDRMLVASITRVKSSTLDYIIEFVLLLLRISIAVLIAISISKPLEIKLFSKVITREMINSKKTIVDSYTNISKSGQEKATEMHRLAQTEITRARNSKEYQNAVVICEESRRHLHELRNIQLQKNHFAAIESSAESTPDAITEAKTALQNIYANHPKLQLEIRTQQESYNAAYKYLNKLRNSISDQQKLAKDAAKSVDNYKQQYENDVARLKQDQAALDVAFDPNDFMNSIYQLHNSKNPTVALADKVITLLFFLIEVMPLLMKMLSSKGTYDFNLKKKYEDAQMAYVVKKHAQQQLLTFIKGQIDSSISEIRRTTGEGTLRERLETWLNSSLKPLFDMIFETRNSDDTLRYSFSADTAAAAVDEEQARVSQLISNTYVVLFGSIVFLTLCHVLKIFPDLNPMAFIPTVVTVSGLYFTITKFKLFRK